MVEGQGALGRTPENHQERQLDVCPTCERDFREIQDYPRVVIVSVSFVTSNDVPPEIPDWFLEELLEGPKQRLGLKLIPDEVLRYFRSNPDKDRLVHSDGFIYRRPEIYNRPGVVIVGGDRYERQFNHAPTMRALLERNEPLKEYLESLRQMVGQEVPPRKLFPPWQQDSYFPNMFHVPSGFGVPDAGGRFLLGLTEGEERTTEYYRVAEVTIWGEGPNPGRGGDLQRIMPIGALNYEGKINRT